MTAKGDAEYQKQKRAYLRRRAANRARRQSGQPLKPELPKPKRPS